MIDFFLLGVIPVTMASLGLLVYLSNPHSITNKLFLGMAICLAGSALGATAFNVTANVPWAFFWVKWTMVFAALLNPILLMFIFAYPGDKVKLPKMVIAADIIVCSFLAVSSVANWLFTHVSSGSAGLQVHPGMLIGAFGMIFAAHLVVLFARLWQQIQHTTGRQQVQWRYLALGLFAMLSGVAVCNVLLVVAFGITRFTGLGVSFILFFEGAIFYAITRHRLLDIRFVVARTVGYVALVGLLFTLYTVSVFAISSLVFRGQVESGQVFVYAILAIAVGATYQPLNTRLQRLTQKIFHQSNYDSADLLLRVTKTLASTYSIQKLSQYVVEEMIKTLNVDRGAMVVSKSGTFDTRFQLGFPSQDLHLEEIEPLRHQKLVVEVPDLSDAKLRDRLRSMGIAVAVPLYVGQVLQGFLLLGGKQSGEMFTNQDMTVLEILRQELAVAIENALSYDQISHFNQELEQKVHQATKELRVANEQLSQKNQQLEQLDKLKDEFISVTSHELRTPLTAIRGYIWMAQHGKKKDQSFDQYMDRAYISTERMIGMVNDTLDISRIESGRVELTPEAIDLSALAQDVATELAPKALERHQVVVVKKSPGLPRAFADANKIHQVMTNLVGNALKFTPEKGKIILSFTHDHLAVTMSVADNGPGMSAEGQRKIFQKFARLEETASTQGTGLGLYLCKQIIELSQGRIWVESQPGKGANFQFSLPIASDQVSILPAKKHQFKNPGVITAS